MLNAPRVTSTLSEGYSCLDAVVASGVGEPSPSEQSRFKAEIDDSARVLEIVTAADWHALCISYPRTNQWSSSPAGVGTLTPDWDRVDSWEGIHLTLLALFTVPFVPYNSEAGTTMMWSWNTEGTLWLPGGLLRAGAPLPPLRCNPNTESQDITPLMSADLGCTTTPPPTPAYFGHPGVGGGVFRESSPAVLIRVVPAPPRFCPARRT